MQPRPDLSNHAVTVETADAEVSCFARPRYLGSTLVATLIGVALSFLPLIYLSPTVKHLVQRVRIGKVEFYELFVLLLCVTPSLLAMAVLVNVLIRLRRPRGFTIQLGVVTVFTPDDGISRQVFELNNLKGATLSRSLTSNSVVLHFTRRRGLAINVLRNYTYAEIGHIVDLVNLMVTDERSFAFEVIPLPRPSPGQSSQVISSGNGT